jgi:hypothetical protein
MFTSIMRRLVLVLLHLALVIALWTTGLARISERSTSVSLLRGIGTHLINPVLASNSFGVAQSAYAQLAQQAQTAPTLPLDIHGLKVQVLGRDLLDSKQQPLSYDAGTRAIYDKVAQAYYAGGAASAFDLPILPAGLRSTLTDYGSLAQFAQVHGVTIPFPQVPLALLNVFGRIGLSPTTLTAEGHASYVTTATIAWGVAAVLGLLLILLSRRWGRISSVAWALFNTALPGVIILAVGWFLVTRMTTVPQLAGSFSGVVGGAFIPVYGGAALVGLGGVLFAKVLGLIERRLNKVASVRRLPSPIPATVMAHPRQDFRPIAPSYPSMPRDPAGPVDPNADTFPF